MDTSTSTQQVQVEPSLSIDPTVSSTINSGLSGIEFPTKASTDSTPESTEDAHEDSSASNSTCPICLGSLSPSDLLYPIPCLQLCRFHVCSQCLSNMRSASNKDTWVEASDGNLFRITMKCPNCRTVYPEPLVQQVLLLRHYASLGHMTSSPMMEEAQQQYHAYRLQLQARQEEANTCGHTNNQEDKPVDTSLLAGLESIMTQQEQSYITSLFTSGDCNQVAQAAMALNQMAILSRTRAPSSTNTTTNTNTTWTTGPKKEPGSSNSPIHHSTGYSNYNRVSSKTASTSSQELVLKKEQQWKRLHPLPVRWPQAFTLHVDFDPLDLYSRSCPLSFMDDETTLKSCYQAINTDDSPWIEWIQDAYCRLTIQGTKVSRQSMEQREGVEYLTQFWMHRNTTPTPTATLPVNDGTLPLVDGCTVPGTTTSISTTTTTNTATTGHLFSWNNPQLLWKTVVQETLSKVKRFTHSKNTDTALYSDPTPLSNRKETMDSKIISSDINTMIPWRRIVISSVRGPLVRLGIRPGDVITHINGEPFVGNSQGLRHVLSTQRGNSVQIVVNAERGIAKALWLRAQAP